MQSRLSRCGILEAGCINKPAEIRSRSSPRSLHGASSGRLKVKVLAVILVVEILDPRQSQPLRSSAKRSAD